MNTTFNLSEFRTVTANMGITISLEVVDSRVANNSVKAQSLTLEQYNAKSQQFLHSIANDLPTLSHRFTQCVVVAWSEPESGAGLVVAREAGLGEVLKPRARRTFSTLLIIQVRHTIEFA